MSENIFSSGVVSADERNERARRAVKNFRAMQFTLTGYARALTGRKDVSVELATGVPRTDGKKIYFKPPMALGDTTPHKRMYCDKRDPQTLIQLCPACEVREEVLISVIHEIAHIVFGTFEKVDPKAVSEAMDRAIKENGTKYARKIEEVWDKIPDYKKQDYLNLSGLISPFLPILVNALEDARVDESMFRVRKGTRAMFDALIQKTFRDGIEEVDGSMSHWKDRPLNSQALIGVFVLCCRYNYEGWFSPEVEEALADKQLRFLCSQVDTMRSASATYDMAFPVLARLRELGFCRSDQDPEDEEEQQDESAEDSDEPDEEEQDGDPGEDDSEADGSESGESDDGSDDSDDSPEAEPDADGPGEPGEDPGGEASDPGEAPEGAGEPDEDALGDQPGEGSDSDDPADEAGEGSGDTDDDTESPGEQPSSDSEPGEGGEPEGELQPGDPEDSGDDSADEAVPGVSEPGDDGDDPSDGADADEGGSDDDSEIRDGDEDPDVDRASDHENAGQGEGGDGSESEQDGDSDEQSSDGGTGSDDEASSLGEGSLGDGSGDGDSSETSSDDDSDGSGDSDDAATGDSEVRGGLDDPSVRGPEIGEGVDDSADQSVAAGGLDDGEPSEDSSLEREGDSPEDDGVSDERVDTLADDGMGGDKVDSNPKYGDAERAFEDVFIFNKHDVYHDPSPEEKTHEEKLDDKALDMAIMQGGYFETPSINVAGVREHTYANRENDRHADGWNNYEDESYKDFLKMFGAEGDLTVEESVLAPVLREMRRVFADNRRNKMERNKKDGKINSKVLGKRAPFNDPRLFQKKRVPGKRDYAVLLGLDISGSTIGENLHLIKRAAKAQAELLERIGIRFAVYAHSGSGGWGMEDLMLDIYCIKSFDDPWDSPHQEALDNLCSDAQNLDGHTIEFYRKALERENVTDRVLMYYTDGKMPAENHDEELEILQREIRYCRSRNIHLMGVGIRTDSPVRHGLPTVQVDNDEDLVKVIRHLESGLLRHR